MRLGIATIFAVAVDGTLALASVVSTPWLVAGLGHEQYGTLALVTVLASQLAFLQLGVPAAVVRCVAEAQHQEAREREAVAFASWVLGVGSALLAAGGAAALAAWGSNALVATAQMTTPQPGLVLVTAAVVGAQPLLAVATALLLGAGRFGSTNSFRLGHGLPRVLVPALLARFGHGVTAVLLCQATIDLAAVVVARSVGRTGVSTARGSVAPWLHLRKLIRIGAPLAAAGLLAGPLADFEKLVLASTHTVSAVAYYAVPYGVSVRILAVATSFSGFLLVRLTAAHAAGDRARARNLLDLGDRVSGAAVSIPAIALIAVAPELLELWLGMDFARASALPARVLLVGVVFNASAYAAHAAIRGVASPYVLPLLYAVEVPLYIGLAQLTVEPWGPSGAALAWSLRTAADAIALHVLARRGLGAQHEWISGRVFLPGLVAAGFTLWLQSHGPLSLSCRLTLAVALPTVVAVSTLRRQDWVAMQESLGLRTGNRSDGPRTQGRSPRA